MPLPGNCLVCAFLLWLRFGGRIVMQKRWRKIPHFYVVTRNRQLWQFKRVQNILPPPLCHCLFIGRFERKR